MKGFILGEFAGILLWIFLTITCAFADESGLKHALRERLSNDLVATVDDQVGCSNSMCTIFANTCCYGHYCNVLVCATCPGLNQACRSGGCCFPGLVCVSGVCVQPTRAPTLPTSSPTTARPTPPTPAPTPHPTCIANMPATRGVQAALTVADSQLRSCASNITALRVDVVNPIADVISRLSLMGKVIEIPSKIVNTLQDLVSRLNAVPFSNLLKVVPPPYKAIITVALKVFDIVLRVVRLLLDALDKVKGVLKKLSDAFTALKVTLMALSGSYTAWGATASAFGGIENRAIECVVNTNHCTDDTALETSNTNFRPTTDNWSNSGTSCVSSFNTMKSKLLEIRDMIVSPILDAIETVLNLIVQAIQPVVDKIEEWYKKIMDSLTEAYCCVNPTSGQAVSQVVALTLDLITCPINGLVTGLMTQITNQFVALQNKINELMNLMMKPIQDKVRSISVPLSVTITEGSLLSCVLKFPAVVITSGNPFQTFVDYTFPIATVPAVDFSGIGNAIKTECDNALNGFSNVLNVEDCCKFYQPLANGIFCDPSNIIPYKHCSQCSSGQNSFWYSLGHQACGDTCIPDGKVSFQTGWISVHIRILNRNARLTFLKYNSFV